jgi:hypothetical protein
VSAIVIVVYTREFGIESDTFADEAEAIEYADELKLLAAYRQLEVCCARVHVNLDMLTPFHRTKEG